MVSLVSPKNCIDGSSVKKRDLLIIWINLVWIAIKAEAFKDIVEKSIFNPVVLSPFFVPKERSVDL
jgi:hypothetical protein